MNNPGAIGDVTGDALSSRLYSAAAKKCVCPFDPNGPPSEIADWPSVSFTRLLPLVELVVVNPDSAASGPDGRHTSTMSPCSLVPPLLVTMLIALPVEPPYSAVN